MSLKFRLETLANMGPSWGSLVIQDFFFSPEARQSILLHLCCICICLCVCTFEHRFPCQGNIPHYAIKTVYQMIHLFENSLVFSFKHVFSSTFHDFHVFFSIISSFAVMYLFIFCYHYLILSFIYPFVSPPILSEHP